MWNHLTKHPGRSWGAWIQSLDSMLGPDIRFQWPPYCQATTFTVIYSVNHIEFHHFTKIWWWNQKLIACVYLTGSADKPCFSSLAEVYQTCQWGSHERIKEIYSCLITIHAKSNCLLQHVTSEFSFYWEWRGCPSNIYAMKVEYHLSFKEGR